MRLILLASCFWTLDNWVRDHRHRCSLVSNLDNYLHGPLTVSQESPSVSLQWNLIRLLSNVNITYLIAFTVKRCQVSRILQRNIWAEYACIPFSYALAALPDLINIRVSCIIMREPSRCWLGVLSLGLGNRRTRCWRPGWHEHSCCPLLLLAIHAVRLLTVSVLYTCFAGFWCHIRRTNSLIRSLTLYAVNTGALTRYSCTPNNSVFHPVDAVV